MYVCVCNAITERHVREHALAQPGTRLRDLRDNLGLASCCGHCCRHAQEILKEVARTGTGPACGEACR